MLGRRPLRVQPRNRFFNVLYLLLFRCSKSGQLPLLRVTVQICLCFGEASALCSDFGAESANLGTGDVAVGMGEPGSAGFTSSMFSWALLFHVAPFPVAACKVGSGVEAHGEELVERR
jgi:hypothetical protein